MSEITATNFHNADVTFRHVVKKFLSLPLVREESRNGPVLRHVGPLVTAYDPRFVPVLRSSVRDANPFFHLVESLYFLAGRNDLSTLEFFNSTYGKYSDDGKTLWGSYGWRWIQKFGHDQLLYIFRELTANRSSRRCVLQMWDGYDDPERVLSSGADVPCNMSVVFDPCDGVLNMHVFNRSNDLVYGALGANQVHFNLLHSYVCSVVGMKKGFYYQVSANTHVYTEFPITKKILQPVDNWLGKSGTDDVFTPEFNSTLTTETWSTETELCFLKSMLPACVLKCMYPASPNDLVDRHVKTVRYLDGYFDEISLAFEKLNRKAISPECFQDDIAVAGSNLMQHRQLSPEMYMGVLDDLVAMVNAYSCFKSVPGSEGTRLAIEALEYLGSTESPWIIAGKEWMERRHAQRLSKDAQ